jgi:GxxExxY protein
MKQENYKHSEITDKIIKAFYVVYNKLGFGFLERVYVKALLIELRKSGLIVTNQVPIKVYYERVEVGLYYAEAMVENVVILELNTAEGLIEEHEAQLVNYLKASEIEVGLLLNFGKEPSFKRKVFSNQYKTLL